MLNKLLVLSFFSIISFPVFSETYVCSQELSRFNRPGEIETFKLERIGNRFKDLPGGWFYQIDHESKSFLILNKVSSLPSLTNVFINKDTKEWGGVYLSMEEFKKDQPDPLSYGKCVVVN